MSNGSPDFKLGELSAAVEALQGAIHDLGRTVDRLDRKVDELRLWKSQVLGMAAGISFIISCVMWLVPKLFAR